MEEEDQVFDEEVQHSYKTRRKRLFHHETPLRKFRIPNNRLPVKIEQAPSLTYEELGLLPIESFNYETYEKVLMSLFRIGADTVDVDMQLASQKGHGEQKLCAVVITQNG